MKYDIETFKEECGYLKISDLAEKYNVSKTTISNWKKKHGLSRPKRDKGSYVQDMLEIGVKVTNFKGSNYLTDHECMTCGHSYSVMPPSQVRNGTVIGCSICRKESHRLAYKSRHEDFLRDTPYSMIGEFTTTQSKTNHKCGICNHVWSPKPHDLMFNYTGCPSCATKGKQLGLYIIEFEGGIFKIGITVDPKKRLSKFPKHVLHSFITGPREDIKDLEKFYLTYLKLNNMLYNANILNSGNSETYKIFLDKTT